MPSLRMRLFGSPQITMDGAPVDITRDKSLALLIYLVSTQTPQRRDRLAAMFWPEASQTTARAYLRNALYTLSKSLGSGWFKTDRKQIALDSDADLQTDVQVFELQLAAAKAVPGVAVEHLTQAAALAQDEFLAGFFLHDAPEFDDWLLFQRESLHRKLDGALQSLIAHHQSRQEYETAIAYARRQVALDPLHEPAQCALIQLYALSGQKAAALRQYEEVALLLREELDAEPSYETRSLYDDIRLAQPVETTALAIQPPEPGLVGGGPGAVDTEAAYSPGFPHPPTPLVGREEDLERLDRLLDAGDGRLITILGPGGMGKTRLGLACAERQVQRRHFPDGIFFVPLGPLESVEHMAPAIATVMGCVLRPEQDRRTPEQQMVDCLQDKRALLVLDSFEHLIEGAGLVSDILYGAPNVRVLVTSRERLHMHAEQVYVLDGLPYGDPDAPDPSLDTDAVHLFVQSAHRSAPQTALTGDDLAYADQICRLVQGMPLAIELAAAWLDLLSPAEIAAEIQRSVDFLEADMCDAPARHHSIRAVFDTTWQTLSAQDRDAFAALSVFRGGFTREAAREVAGATLHQLSNLAGKSLIQRGRREFRGRYRYTIHELLRQYARTMLARSPEAAFGARSRHCHYYASFLHTRLPTIHGRDQAQAADDITRDLDNVRAAWQWAVEHQDVEAIHMAATTFFLYCQLRSHFLEGAEAMAAAASALRMAGPSQLRDATLAQVLNHEGWLHIRVGALDQAAEALEVSRALYARPGMAPPPPHMGSDPTSPLAMIAQMRGDYAQAVELGEEALQAGVLREDPYGQVYAHYALTSIRAAQGDLDAAAHHGQQACHLAQAAGNRWFSAIPLNEWGRAARAAGKLDEAKRHFRDSHDIMREYADREGMAVALNELGEIAFVQQDFSEAEQLFRESLDLYQGLSDRVGRATAMTGLARVAGAQGSAAAACALYARALELAAQTTFQALVFTIFAHAGELLLAQGRTAAGILALTQVSERPATVPEARSQAARILNEWRTRVDPELHREALRQVHEDDLQRTVAVVKAELSEIAQAEPQT